MTSRPLVYSCSCLLIALASSPAVSQEPRVRPSQHGGVSQTVDRTTITIAYDRPVARGRDLFGGIVPFGQVWTPGANWATRIGFDTDVTIEGNAVPAGRYSLWTIPDRNEWTVILITRDSVFHNRYPSDADLVRFHVQPEEGAHMETLAYYFPIVAADSTVLHIHWGTTVVPITIRVPPGG